MKMPKYTILRFRTFLAILILAVVSTVSYAQVDQDELKDLPPVVFINYEGPHAVINTREEIRQIGVAVGQSIANSERDLAPTLAAMSVDERRAYTYRFNAGYQNRYFVIHSVSAVEGTKIDADIFGLGVDTGVDHVRNLRTIIQGYLQTAYNYSAADAALLAEYITIYNAVYRGNWDYFLDRYKTPVISNLTRERVGLSIRYDEWPGRTLIVIPLGIGGLSSIDTSVISDSRVIEEMRREDDQSVPQRQEMVDLKEREADQAAQSAQTEREAVRQEQAQVTVERQEVAQERQEVVQERQQTQEDLQAGRITEEEARATLETIDRREAVLRQKESELDKREDELAQRSEEAQRLDEFAEQKADEARQDRDSIARDQQAAIAEETGGIIGIIIERTSPVSMGRVVRISPTTGREIRRSPLNVVHVKTVAFIGGRIIAIAGEATGSGAVRLVEINQNSLEMAKQGDDNIRSGSLLWVNGNDIYAITINSADNKCYLGRFDTNLTLRARSAVAVHQESSVAIQQARLLTQREDGSVLILNPSDLTEIQFGR